MDTFITFKFKLFMRYVNGFVPPPSPSPPRPRRRQRPVVGKRGALDSSSKSLRFYAFHHTTSSQLRSVCRVVVVLCRIVRSFLPRSYKHSEHSTSEKSPNQRNSPKQSEHFVLLQV
eukprot:204978-Prorocentrum_minimum.AAC.3